MANPNFKQINVDIQTHATIQMHAKRANRSVAGEIRELCALVYTPRNGEEVLTGVATVVRADGETVVENALEQKTVVATGRMINHEPAHGPAEAIAPTGKYAEVLELQESCDLLTDQYNEAVAAGADDHTLQCLANEIGAAGQELDALQSVEEKEG